MIMNYEKTRKGLPALWESGGSMTNSGKSQIICGSNDERLKAIYIPRGGELSCGKHALIPIKIGDKVIIVSHQRKDFTIKIYQIKSIEKYEERLVMEAINTWQEGEWENDDDNSTLANSFSVQATMDKATCYHCREPHYILNDK